MQIILPAPPWTELGRKIESLIRKAGHEFSLFEGISSLGVALSGGKDSITLLAFLKALSGKGIPPFKIHGFHVSGDYSCGASVATRYLEALCSEFQVPLTILQSNQQLETLECYSCSRMRRKLLFDACKSAGIDTIAFGHHQDDHLETLLMNLFQKGEFEGMHPKLRMIRYGVTILRPLWFVPESLILEFAKLYQFARIVCQCPVGQHSLRKKTRELFGSIKERFPSFKESLTKATLLSGSKKALKDDTL